MKYEIWQIVDIRNTDYAFRSWDKAERMFTIKHYMCVYEGTMRKENILNNLWEVFNINHPEDFRGHSLSVSDVVALKDEDKDCWYWYYCDSLGWKEITEIVQL